MGASAGGQARNRAAPCADVARVELLRLFQPRPIRLAGGAAKAYHRSMPSMPDTPDATQLTATTLAGLEETLAAELASLGAARVTKAHRAVCFEGDRAMLYRANLMCRTAIRVLKPVARFRVHKETVLYKAVQRIDWSAFLEATGNLWVNSGLHESKITQEVLDVVGMSSPKVRHFLNNICNRPGTRYLEIGSHFGSTLISAVRRHFQRVRPERAASQAGKAATFATEMISSKLAGTPHVPSPSHR